MHPKAMPLDAYLAETLSMLSEYPEAGEIVAERARAMRFAERDNYDGFFARYNNGWAAAQAR